MCILIVVNNRSYLRAHIKSGKISLKNPLKDITADT